jgi:hypothetical protein
MSKNLYPDFSQECDFNRFEIYIPFISDKAYNDALFELYKELQTTFGEVSIKAPNLEDEDSNEPFYQNIPQTFLRAKSIVIIIFAKNSWDAIKFFHTNRSVWSEKIGQEIIILLSQVQNVR